MKYILLNQSSGMYYLANISDEYEVWTSNVEYAMEFDSVEQMQEEIKDRFNNGIMGQLSILEKNND